MRFLPVLVTSIPLLLSSLPADAFDPCGGSAGSLWSWAWAGQAGENVTTRSGPYGPVITELRDISGNGRHYFNTTGEREPGYQVGLRQGGYETDLPVVAIDRYANGSQLYLQWMNQNDTMRANEFYLAFAGMNSRDAGNRDLWGNNTTNLVWLDQGGNRAYIVINGSEVQLTPRGSLPKGPLLLEIWRDETGKLHTWANGQDVSSPGASSSATFSMTGIGWDQSGTSGWDDYAFEYVACDDDVTDLGRRDVREYLNAKWGLFGSSNQRSTPQPPSNLKSD